MKKKNNFIKVIPLGGLEQIGMNITAFEYEDSIIVVDCGMAFPGEGMPGIDFVIPDISYLRENAEKVKGFIITHGHEDHIGALPYVLKEITAPVYATKLTTGIIDQKLKEHKVRKIRKKVVKYGQSINLGPFRIEFIRTNHSITDAAALAIHTPVGVLVHTGDFKIDYTPVYGDTMDLQRFGELGKKGVLALLCDSSNAEKPGFSMSEKVVGDAFDQIFADHIESRIIVATSVSNVDRVQQIMNSSCKYGRKVAIEGKNMISILSTAMDLGYLSFPENTLVSLDELRRYPLEKTVIISTGSQGESMETLLQIAASTHKKVKIRQGDVIIFSASPIPGNEKTFTKVINELSMKGAEVIMQDTNVSGHAHQEEIKLIYSLLHPKYAIPVHGEFRHLKAQAGIARGLGMDKDNIFLLSSGDVLSIGEEEARITEKVQTGAILVDGLGVGDIGNIVLRDRQHLAEDGILVVMITLEKYTNTLLAGPDIVSRGFVYVREAEDLMEDAKHVIEEALHDCIQRDHREWNQMKNAVKDALSDYLWKKTKRSPLILPIIMEAG